MINNRDNKKPHADDTRLKGVLADCQKPTDEALESHPVLSALYRANLTDKLLQPTRDISTTEGPMAGDYITTEQVVVLISDRDDQPVSLAVYTLSSNKKEDLTDPSALGALVMGDLDNADRIIAVKGDILEAIALYDELVIKQGLSIAVLFCFNPRMFIDVVKHFAQVSTVTILATRDTTDTRNKDLKLLAGANVEALVTMCELSVMLENESSFDNVINNPDTIIRDLKAEGWPKPEPLITDLPPVLSLTADMMPNSLAEYSKKQAERLTGPLEYIAIPLVIGLGSIISPRLGMLPKRFDNWEVVPNLWGAIIGNPSTKKSPALEAGLLPLSNLVYQAGQKHEEDKKAYACHKEINKYKADAVEKQLKSLAQKQANQSDDDEDKITDEELLAKAQAIADANDSEDGEPMLRRYVVKDPTYQKLGEILSHSSGILMERDELTGFLSSIDGQDKGEAREFYLSAYNGTGSHSMDRVGRGSIFIENHCVSIIGGIQPNKLEKYLAQTIKGLGNDGLVQRFQLAVYPDHIKGLKENDVAVDAETRDAVYHIFETINNMTIGDFVKYGANPPDNFHKRPYFYFTLEAYKIYLNWYDELKLEAEEEEHSVIAEHLMKYPKTIAALALIFHLVDSIEQGQSLGPVSRQALEAALKWYEVLKTHMTRIYSLVTDSANIKAAYLAEKIAVMARKGGDKTDRTNWVSYGFTARQLVRRSWKGLTDADDVRNALEVLVENDWLRWETVESTGQGGRPTERYFINPRLNEVI